MRWLGRRGGWAGVLALVLASLAAPAALAQAPVPVDLSLTMSASGSTLEAGADQLMLTLVVENRGPGDATGVTVSGRPLRRGVRPVAADPSQGSCTISGGTLSCSLGTVVAGGSAQVLVIAKTSGLTVGYTARVSGDRPEATPGDNQDSVRAIPPIVEPLEPTPSNPAPTMPDYTDDVDLGIDTRVRAGRVIVGRPVRYTITVTNRGPQTARHVKVTDTLNAPVRLASVSATAGTCRQQIPITCSLRTIRAGESVTVTVLAEHQQEGCWQRNAASVTSSGFDHDTTDNLDTAGVCEAALELTRVPGRANIRAGHALRYRIRVRNPSGRAVREIRVCERLASGLVFVGSAPSASLRGGLRCWTVERLAAGQARTFRVTVRALPGTSGRKVSRATASSPDAETARTSGTVRVPASGARPGGVAG